MIFEDLIVEQYSTLMIEVTKIKWTSFSSNKFKMIVRSGLSPLESGLGPMCATTVDEI